MYHGTSINEISQHGISSFNQIEFPQHARIRYDTSVVGQYVTYLAPNIIPFNMLTGC